MQKHNRRKAAKDHVRQKLQEHTGLTPQSVHSVQPLDSNDGITTKLKKCCVSFKLLSPGSACSCGLVLAQSNDECAVSDACIDECGKNKGFGADVSQEQNSDLLQSVNSENLWPESHSELVASESHLIKPDCHQQNTSCSLAVSCSTADHHPNLHSREVSMLQQVAAVPEDANRQCASGLHDSEKSDAKIGSSLTANSLNASQKLRLSNTQNTSAVPANSSGFELNFSSLDDNLFACLVDNDCFPCDNYSAEIEDACKKDISVSVAHSVEPNSIGTVTGYTVDNREPFIDSDDTASLCRALSVIKVAVAESVKSGVTDFALPESQYGEIVRSKVSNEDRSINTVDKNMAERMMHDDSFGLSCWSSSPLSLSSDGRQSTHQIQRYTAYTHLYLPVQKCSLCRKSNL